MFFPSLCSFLGPPLDPPLGLKGKKVVSPYVLLVKSQSINSFLTIASFRKDKRIIYLQCYLHLKDNWTVYAVLSVISEWYIYLPSSHLNCKIIQNITSEEVLSKTQYIQLFFHLHPTLCDNIPLRTFNFGKKATKVL